MTFLFHVLATPHFERDAKRLAKKNSKLVDQLEELFVALRADPCNQTGRHDVKKLEGLKQGEGQWRIRISNYRLRYDIVDRDVVLYSIRHRKEAY
jgi:addiction module RelE/StbE family toxin